MPLTSATVQRRLVDRLFTPSPAPRPAPPPVADLSALATLTDAHAFIQESFLQILGREPDVLGFHHILAGWQRGLPRMYLLYEIATSEEGRTANRPTVGLWHPQPAAHLLALDGEAFLRASYRTIFFRDVDPNGLHHYSSQIALGRPKLDILRELATSEEASRLPAALAVPDGPIDLAWITHITDEGHFLREAYYHILGRAPDLDGYVHYRDLLRLTSRPVVIRQLASSMEAVARGLHFLLPPETPRASFVARAGRLLSQLRGSRHRQPAPDPALDGLARLSAQVDALRAEIRRHVHEQDGQADRLQTAQASRNAEVQQTLEDLSRTLQSFPLVALRDELRERAMAHRADIELLSHKLDTYTSETLRRVEAARNAEVEQTLADISNTLRSKITTLGDELQEHTVANRAGIELLSRKLDTYTSETLHRSEAAAVAASESFLRVLAGLEQGQQKQNESTSLVSSKLDQYTAASLDRLAFAQADLDHLMHRSERAAISAGSGIVVAQVAGFLLGLPAEEWRLTAHYALRGPLEPGVVRLFERLVQPGMTIVDVGAHVGLYTLLAARASAASVHSFEPTPRIFEILKGNVQLNGFLESGRIHLHPAALADRTGTRSLAVYADDSGHNTLFPLSPTDTTLSVPVQCLDEALPPNTRVDLLKIDAEGAEPLILRGLAHTRSWSPGLRIVMEFAPSHLQRSGWAPRDFLSELSNSNWRVQRIDDLTGDLHELEVSTLIETASSNLLLS